MTNSNFQLEMIQLIQKKFYIYSSIFMFTAPYLRYQTTSGDFKFLKYIIKRT